MKKLFAFILLSLLAVIVSACNSKSSPAGSDPVHTRIPLDNYGDWIGYRTSEQALARADLVFTGKVIGITSKEMNTAINPPVNPDGTLYGTTLYTIYEVEIDEVLYGEWDEPTVAVASEGGLVDGVLYHYEDAVPIEYLKSYMFMTRSPKPYFPELEEVFLSNPFQWVMPLDAKSLAQNAELPVNYEGVLAAIAQNNDYQGNDDDQGEGEDSEDEDGEDEDAGNSNGNQDEDGNGKRKEPPPSEEDKDAEDGGESENGDEEETGTDPDVSDDAEPGDEANDDEPATESDNPSSGNGNSQGNGNGNGNKKPGNENQQ